MIDVLESEEITRGWAQRVGFTLPVLMDLDGKVAESYAPEGVLPELPRNQIPIASNLIIDREGRIRFYELLDSRNFDAQLVRLKTRLDALLDAEEPAAAGAPAAEARPAAESPDAEGPRAVAGLEWPDRVTVAPGETVTVPVRVRVDPEHHVMANPASEDWLVPLRLAMESGDGLALGEIRYPAATPFVVGEDTFATYHGDVVLEVPVTAAPDATPGKRVLHGSLEFQGCSRHACRMPAEIPVQVEVEVTGPGQ